MANDVFRAIDASLVLGVDNAESGEGQSAEGLIERYGLSNTVGRLRNVQVTVSSDVKPFYEIGRRYPTHLRPGVIRISGSAERAHINGALLRLLLGDGAVSPPASPNFAQPAFNIVTSLVSPAAPGDVVKVTIFGVKFDTWHFSLPADEFVMEGVQFQAMRIAMEES